MGIGLWWPVWVKRATIWPPPSPATTRWSWLGSELAGRFRHPKQSRVWRPLPDRPLTPRNTPFPPSNSRGLSPSVSAGLEKGGNPSRRRRGEVCRGRGSRLRPPSQSVPGALQVLAGLAGGKGLWPIPRFPQSYLLYLSNCSGGFQVCRIRFRPQINLLTATPMRFKAFLMFLPQNSD